MDKQIEELKEELAVKKAQYEKQIETTK